MCRTGLDKWHNGSRAPAAIWIAGRGHFGAPGLVVDPVGTYTDPGPEPVGTCGAAPPVNLAGRIESALGGRRWEVLRSQGQLGAQPF